jgi:hypothetical protein
LSAIADMIDVIAEKDCVQKYKEKSNSITGSENTKEFGTIK